MKRLITRPGRPGNLRAAIPVHIDMIARIAFRVFLACLIACASMALFAIWFGEHLAGPLYFQTAASLFIVGLAAFLVWFSFTLRAIHAIVTAER